MSNSINAAIYKAVEARGVTQGYTPAQFLKCAIAKLHEEFDEFIQAAGSDDLSAMQIELADIYVVVACLEQTIIQYSGQEFDVIHLAFEKATADIGRRIKQLNLELGAVR
jgi:NTP pyrophosphatase (non-canonical NTP hydrolase)